jgi:hypothetical protein
MTPADLRALAADHGAIRMRPHETSAALLAAAELIEQRHGSEPVAWMESPHGEIRMNPLYRLTFPSQLLQWQIPLYLTPQPVEQRKPLTDKELRAKFAELYPDDDALLLAGRDYLVEAIGARARWSAFQLGARAIEVAHGIKEAT